MANINQKFSTYTQRIRRLSVGGSSVLLLRYSLGTWNVMSLSCTFIVTLVPVSLTLFPGSVDSRASGKIAKCNHITICLLTLCIREAQRYFCKK